MNLEELGSFKDKAISRLIQDDNIVDVLIGDAAKDPDADIETLLLGESGSGANGCVFKFEYVPDTQENAKTFLCVEDVPIQSASGDTIVGIKLYVFAYCSKSIMQTYRRANAAGTRIDILMSDIDKILNGNRDFGIGKLIREDGDIYKPEKTYYGRMAVYSVASFS